MNSSAKIFAVLLTLLTPIISYAQITVTGQIRPRTEYLHGFGTLSATDQDAAFYTSQRSRMNFDLKQNDVQVFISLQDIRVWGNQPQLVANAGALTALHQAYAKFDIDTNWSLKLGRQEFSYDDHRILGNVGWAQQARSHDAALAVYQKGTFQGHLALAFNQSAPQLIGTNYTTPSNYKSLQFIWLNKKWDNLKASVLILNNGRQFTDTTGDYHTNYTQTIGTRLTYSKGAIVSNLAGYYQMGTGVDMNQTTVNAHYAAFDFAYKVAKKTTALVGFEMLSGNDFVNPNNENNAFAPLYGTNHKFNGLMDYFYVGNHGGNIGLNDVYVTVKQKVAGFKVIATAHQFMANGAMLNPNNGGNAADKNLGSELDIVVVRKINDQTMLKMGYSQLFGTESMEFLKGGDMNATNNWAWVMIDFQPRFLLSKNK